MAVMSSDEVEAAVRTLQQDGYVVVPDVVDPQRLQSLADHLRSEYDRLRLEGALFGGGGSISGHLNCYPGEQSRFTLEAIRTHGLVDVVRAFDPDIVDCVRATTNFNLPGSRVQHFHSDGLFTEAFVICNIAVVDTDEVNGAIDVIPGTHRQFYPFWKYASQRQYRNSKRVCMKQGDTLLRISTMWHRGMPNRSSAPRPMMSLTFGELSAPMGDPFGGPAGGAVEFTPNWYGTGRVARAREQAFVRAPWLYSSLRFTRSLVGNKGYSSW